MKVYYDARPSVVEAVGNGSFRYHWNIELVGAPKHHDEDEEERTQWRADEVIVWQPLTPNRITEVVISELWAVDYEQKLINEYNAAQMGLMGDEEAAVRIEAYKSFLMARAEVKAKVDADCAELGIV